MTALLAATVTAAATVAALLAPSPASAGTPTARADRAIQRSLDDLVARRGFPGVLASVRDRDGRVRNYTAGVADLLTGAAVPVDGQVRIASNTKMFTATVVLQLVGEGRIDLDAPVEQYLPEIVRGSGNDGRRITVRQLLQQTSGLPDYDGVLGGGDLLSVVHTYFQPRDLVDAALAHAPGFAPGTKWEYSNTNYVLAGLIVERVTGRPVGEEITRGIIDRVGLRHTYWPGTGEQPIRGRHPHGYYAAKPGDSWVDVTTLDPSLGWAAGQLVSTPSDLARFMRALVGGKLLAPAQLRQMETTVAAPDFDATGTWRYGLGLARTEPSCGGAAWGHGGDIQGFETRNLVTTDGRAAVVTVTALPTSLEAVAHVLAAVDTALCADSTTS